jgi:uncharacterized protein (TIGR02996 family)
MPTLRDLPDAELRAILAAVHAADPADEAPRLVFADWLDDHADPRADLVRVQCELARAERDNDWPAAGRLRDRERAWLAEWHDVWPGFPFLAADRGVLRATVGAETLGFLEDRPELGAVLARAAWIDVTITGICDANAAPIAASLARYEVGRVTLRATYRCGPVPDRSPGGFFRPQTGPPAECLTADGLARLAGVQANLEVSVIDLTGQSPTLLRPLVARPDLVALRLSGQADDAAVAVLAGCGGLRTLDLTGCRRITDAALRHLARLKELRVLRLGECGQLTDAGLGHLAGLTGLRELYLPFCRRVTAAGLRHLRGLPLEVLDLGFVRGLGDAALAEAASLPALRDLRLFFCERLTDAGLRHLHASATLRAVSLGKCDGLTESGVAALRRALPKAAIAR